MKELYKAKSQNGRWGLAIAGEEGKICEGIPFFGKLISLGKVSGVDTYRLDKGTDCFCILEKDTKAITNSKEIKILDLQGGSFVSLLAINPKGYSLIKVFGYKYRSSWYKCYKDGEEVNIPESVLVAMGLIKAEKEEEISFTFENDEKSSLLEKLMSNK